VHAKAGRGVHLADAAADRAVALGDVLGEKVHAAHVEADRRTARSAISRLSGWMTSVTSVAVPPVDRLAVERRYTTWPGVRDRLGGQIRALEHLLRLASSSSRVSTFS
jgi:hypothetical protein